MMTFIHLLYLNAFISCIWMVTPIRFPAWPSSPLSWKRKYGTNVRPSYSMMIIPIHFMYLFLYFLLPFYLQHLQDCSHSFSARDCVKTKGRIALPIIINKNATWRWQWARPVTAIIPYPNAEMNFSNPNTSRDMNYFPPFWSSPDYRQQTESDAYEPTVQVAQVGSIIRSWPGAHGARYILHAWSEWSKLWRWWWTRLDQGIA